MLISGTQYTVAEKTHKAGPAYSCNAPGRPMYMHKISNTQKGGCSPHVTAQRSRHTSIPFDMVQSSLKHRLEQVLKARVERGLLRELRAPQSTAADFSSNDYLGLARPGPFQQFLQKNDCHFSSGATGSRLLSGHSEKITELEHTAAKFHRAEASLLFNSGYDANFSLLSCLPASDDTIVYDELIHASVHDGMRASKAGANTVSFSHNDPKSLENVISKISKQRAGNLLICIETVYSMDGDVAPLERVLEVARKTSDQFKRDIYVIADEAHAGGLYGRFGEGLAVGLHLHNHDNLLARVITFGKAFAAHGAVVLGPQLLVQYLINYARPFIYSTALPPHSIYVLSAVYEFAQTEEARKARCTLWKRIQFFQNLSTQLLCPTVLLSTNGKSPIQGILRAGNRRCLSLSQTLRGQGFDVYAIRSPTVPRGKERIRIIIHAHNTEEEIRRLVLAISKSCDGQSAKL